MNKREWRKRAQAWKRRARKWRKQLGEMEKHSWGWYESYLEVAKQRNALLAWQRRVREAWEAYLQDASNSFDLIGNLRQAIEGDGKEET